MTAIALSCALGTIRKRGAVYLMTGRPDIGSASLVLQVWFGDLYFVFSTSILKSNHLISSFKGQFWLRMVVSGRRFRFKIEVVAQ